MMYDIVVTPGSAISWTKEWPTEIGYYWFYGKTFSGALGLSIVNVDKNKYDEMCGYFVCFEGVRVEDITQGWFSEYLNEYDGYWFPIYTPDADELKQNLKD